MSATRHRFAVLVLFVLTGCTSGVSDEPLDRPSSDEATSVAIDGPSIAADPVLKPVTNRGPLKSVDELQIPVAFQAMCETKRLARKGWAGYEDARVGDVAEYEQSRGVKSRIEVLDVADHGVVIGTTIVVRSTASNWPVIKSAQTLLFIEPDDQPTAVGPYKVESRPSDRKVKSGDKEFAVDTVRETYLDGKLVQKSWTSKQVPCGGGVIAEDSAGNTTALLTSFQRGK
jgi:hypothetical protein